MHLEDAQLMTKENIESLLYNGLSGGESYLAQIFRFEELIIT